jgi:hypothetical protein
MFALKLFMLLGFVVATFAIAPTTTDQDRPDPVVRGPGGDVIRGPGGDCESVVRGPGGDESEKGLIAGKYIMMGGGILVPLRELPSDYCGV